MVRAHEKGGECAHVCALTHMCAREDLASGSCWAPAGQASIPAAETDQEQGDSVPKGRRAEAYPAPGQEGLPAGMELFILWFLLDLFVLGEPPRKYL